MVSKQMRRKLIEAAGDTMAHDDGKKKNPATFNAAVAAVNGFLRYIGREDCCVGVSKTKIL